MQINQSVAYTDEHLDPDGEYHLELYKRDDSIIHAKIQSRHNNNLKYKIWIKYDKIDGSIDGWYCTCRSGARTLGCCAHIASILWHLGYNKYQEKKQRKSLEYQNFVLDVAKLEDEIDDQDWSDDEEESSEDEAD